MANICDNHEELLKLFLEKSHQVQDLQARLNIAEAQLSSQELIDNHIRNTGSPLWESAILEKLEQLIKTQEDLLALLSQSGESDASDESAEEAE